jgi:hypothetical protein
MRGVDNVPRLGLVPVAQPLVLARRRVERRDEDRHGGQDDHLRRDRDGHDCRQHQHHCEPAVGRGQHARHHGGRDCAGRRLGYCVVARVGLLQQVLGWSGRPADCSP